MTKMIEIFRNACIKLLDLTQEGILDPPEDGSRSIYENGSQRISYKSGYHLERTNLINEFFDSYPNIRANCSREYIEKIINAFLFECFFNGENDKTTRIDLFFNKLKNDLKSMNKYLIPIYIDNLNLQDVTIGEVEIIPYSISNLNAIFKKAGSDEIMNEGIQSDMSRVKCVGIVSVDARDIAKAIENAEDLVDQALNVIRLFVLHSNFGILGKYKHSSAYSISSLNVKDHTICYYSGSHGNAFESKMDETQLKKLNEYKSIDNILKKPKNQRDNLESRLLLAINLFGEIQKNSANQDNIIRIFSAFETLLKETHENIIDNVPERISFMSESDKKERLAVFDLVSGMYAKRNELVHGGNTVFKEIDYNTLLNVLRQCIIVITNNIGEYSNLDDLITLIDNARKTGYDTKLSF